MRNEDIEVAIPYGNDYASQHLKPIGARTTLCFRDSYGWTVGDMSVDQALESVFTCKRCINKWRKFKNG